MATVHRARAVLKINKKITASVVGRANAMCVGLDDNPTVFTNPSPTTSAIQTQVGIVNKAEVLAATRAKGAASARNVQRNLLAGMLETELTYIQGIVDKSPTWDQAVATIQAGGLLAAIVPNRVKGVLVITQGPTSGSAILDANVTVLTASLKGKFFFNWQSTVDGKTFVTLPPTPNHKTAVANLTPLTSYGFRVSVTNAAGVEGEWSQIVYFLVR
jgi:hypothetical protein